MTYTMAEIHEWIKQGQAISPHVVREMAIEMNKMERKLAVAEEFVLWLSHCGELQGYPGPESIGIEARYILKRLRNE